MSDLTWKAANNIGYCYSFIWYDMIGENYLHNLPRIKYVS